MISSFEEQLKKTGTLVYYNVGDSMMPLLKENRDLMVLSVPNRPIRKYDAILYKRDSGQYVMHRVIEIREDGYVLCGDNRYCKEYGVKDEQVLAILTSVLRKGKTVSVDSTQYKIYVHLWCDLFIIRAAILRIKHIFLRYVRKFQNAK